MRCLKIFLLALSIFYFSDSLIGQDSLAFKLQQDNLSTINDLNVDQSFTIGPTTLRFQDMLRYKLYSHETSLGGDDQYSIEHQLSSDLYPFSRRRTSIRLESSQYQDHRTGLKSSISNWALLAGYSPSENLTLYFGGRSVRRYGIDDRGWSANLQTKKLWRFNTQSLGIHLGGERDQLDAHQNHHINVSGDYRIRFGRISSYESALRLDSRRQQFFTDSLGSSQLRSNENLMWNNRFTYNLSKRIKLTHALNWGDQSTDIKRERISPSQTNTLSADERKRLVLSNETSLMTTGETISSVSSFKIENSQNKFYVDHSQVLYQLHGELSYHPTHLIDSLTWKNTLSRQEYDTPDTNNDDDRDEWRFKTELSLVYQPTPFSRIEIGSKLSLFHLIYLFSTRSSENYWNRNLVLWTEYDWILNAWSGKARAHIRSNYFDYDYDDLFIELDQPARSFVHRSLDLSKQVRVRLLPRWSLTSKIASRWEDEGQLDWTDFIQQISSERQQTEFTTRLSFAYRGWLGWVGYLNHQRTTTYASTTRGREIWKGEGPLFGVRHVLGERLYLDLDGRLISVIDGDREYLLPKIFLSLVYH